MAPEQPLAKLKPKFVISAGTQIVLLTATKHLPGDIGFRKAGSVGVVARCPDAVDGPLPNERDRRPVHDLLVRWRLRDN